MVERGDSEGGQPAGAVDETEGAPAETEVAVADVVAVRRAPRYRAFVGVGALALATLATLVALVSGGLPGVVVVLLAGGAAVLGGLLGALVAVLADRSDAR